MKPGLKKLRGFSRLYVILVLLFLYFPVLAVMVYSFDSSRSPSSAAFGGFTLKWYSELFGSPLIDSLKRSLVIAVWSVLAALAAGTPAALVLARRSFRAKSAFENISFLPLMIPEIVLGIAFLSFYSLAGIPFGSFTMILAHITFCIPYVIIMVRTRLAGFDMSLIEASRDLGATGTQTFKNIILPAIVPALISAALLGFAMSLDDVIISFFTAGADSSTLPLQIYSLLKLRPTRVINALCTVTILVAFSTMGLLWFSRRINITGFHFRFRNGKNIHFHHQIKGEQR